MNSELTATEGYEEKHRPIIVVTCGRSGSRLLVSIIESFSIPVLETGYNDHSGDVRESYPLNQLHRFIEPWRNRLDFTWEILDRYSDETQEVVLWLRSVIKSTEKGVKGYGPIVKDPRLLHILPVYMKAFPDARFIHIVRDGRDYAISEQEECRYLNQEVPDIEFLLEIWNFRVSLLEAFRSDTRFMEVRFEDIIENPNSAIESLANFLGLTPSCEIPVLDKSKVRRFENSEIHIPNVDNLEYMKRFAYI